MVFIRAWKWVDALCASMVLRRERVHEQAARRSALEVLIDQTQSGEVMVPDLMARVPMVHEQAARRSALEVPIDQTQSGERWSPA